MPREPETCDLTIHVSVTGETSAGSTPYWDFRTVYHRLPLALVGCFESLLADLAMAVDGLGIEKINAKKLAEPKHFQITLRLLPVQKEYRIVNATYAGLQAFQYALLDAAWGLSKTWQEHGRNKGYACLPPTRLRRLKHLAGAEAT